MVRLILSGIQRHFLQTPVDRVESPLQKFQCEILHFTARGCSRAVLFSKQTTVCREINTTFKIHSNYIDDTNQEKIGQNKATREKT